MIFKNNTMKPRNNTIYLKAQPGDLPTEKPIRYPPILKLIQIGFMTFGNLLPNKAAKLAFKFFSTPRFKAKHRNSDPILESAKLFEILYGSSILKAYQWGNGAPTVLLVHGWESRGTALRTFVPGLLTAGYQVIAFDGPAHGDSGGKRTNLPHFAGAVKAVIQHIGAIDGIIAHSFGGAAAVYALASMQPTTAVDRMVLIAPPDSIKKVVQDAIELFKLPPAAKRKFVEMVERKLEKPLEEADINRAGSRTKIQAVMVVHDLHDRIAPFKGGANIAEKWSNSQLLKTENMGHYALVKHPDVVKHIVDFVVKK